MTVSEKIDSWWNKSSTFFLKRRFYSALGAVNDILPRDPKQKFRVFFSEDNMPHIDYEFNIKPHGIPKLMRYLKLQRLNKIVDENSITVSGSISSAELDLCIHTVGGLRLHRHDPGCWYQFYIDFGSYYLTGIADFANAERIIRNVKIIPERNRVGVDSKIYVGMGEIYSQL